MLFHLYDILYSAEHRLVGKHLNSFDDTETFLKTGLEWHESENIMTIFFYFCEL